MKVKQIMIRWGLYLLGLALLAFGLTLNTKLGLGVSAIMTIPVTVSEIWNLNLGNVTLVLYIFFIVIEMLLHVRMSRKEDGKKLGMYLLLDALQLPLSLVFTRVINLVSSLIPVFSEAFAGSFWGSIRGRVIVLLAAIVITGVGAGTSLNMRLVPNPGDGIVQVLADFTGKPVGFTKNWFDILNVCVALTVGLIFTHGLVGVNVGTILAALGIGRVIALLNRLFGEKMKKAAGLL